MHPRSVKAGGDGRHGFVTLGEESVMELLGLSQKDFGQIMRVCQRVLVNEETWPFWWD